MIQNRAKTVSGRIWHEGPQMPPDMVAARKQRRLQQQQSSATQKRSLANASEYNMWRKGSCTCESCAMNDGAIRRSGEAFPSGATDIGEHGTCDCTIEPVTPEEVQRAIYEDLRRWRGRALDDVKAGRSFRSFASTVIPQATHQIIEATLQRCTTADEVRALFVPETLERHLPGKHDQKTHGHRGGAGSAQADLAKTSVPKASKTPKTSTTPEAFKPTPTPEEQLHTLEQSMAAKYPHAQFDFAGTDPHVMESACKQMDALMSKYPGVAQSVRYVGTDSIRFYGQNIFEDGGTAACGQQFLPNANGEEVAHSFVLLNPQYFGNSQLLQEAVAADEQKGWFPPGVSADAPGYLVTHEFGHAVDNYLQNQGQVQSIAGYLGKNGEGQLSTAVQSFHTANKRGGNAVSGYAKADYMANGTTDEQFAEGFASLHYTPTAQQVPYTQKLGNFLGQVFSPSVVAHSPNNGYTTLHTGQKSHWKQWQQQYIKG